MPDDDDASGPAAQRPDDSPETRSLTERFSVGPADQTPDDVGARVSEPGSAAHLPPTPPENRSLTEPISEPSPTAPNPWARSADTDERRKRADDIGRLLPRWELGTVHRVHALAAVLGLDVREFLVLSELMIRPDAGLTGSELIGVVGGSAARMSALLAGLEERGLVERGPAPFDRRVIVSGASDLAHDLLAREPSPDLRHRLVQDLPRRGR